MINWNIGNIGKKYKFKYIEKINGDSISFWSRFIRFYFDRLLNFIYRNTNSYIATNTKIIIVSCIILHTRCELFARLNFQRMLVNILDSINKRSNFFFSLVHLHYIRNVYPLDLFLYNLPRFHYCQIIPSLISIRSMDQIHSFTKMKTEDHTYILFSTLFRVDSNRSWGSYHGKVGIGVIAVLLKPITRQIQ